MDRGYLKPQTDEMKSINRKGYTCYDIIQVDDLIHTLLKYLSPKADRSINPNKIL